jgi:hypothetical protein
MADSAVKYTPGPWDLDEGDKSTVYELETSELVAEVDRGRSAGETEANGRLIAAAPDLLEALKVFVWPYQEGHGLDDTERQKLGRAAIAKAEGKP